MFKLTKMRMKNQKKKGEASAANKTECVNNPKCFDEAQSFASPKTTGQSGEDCFTDPGVQFARENVA